MRMIRPRIDRWFLRFRQTGHPRWLARVFDQTAPELWRIAAHLARDQQAAEDAVQAAFLAAIEHRDQWDAERPLLPWLLGLLANRVREQRRASLRRIDAERLPPRSEEGGPLAAAMQSELKESVQQALGGIGQPFREVLERHLLHGESAQEIAAGLAVPAVTVRTRLHRGLLQLRERLPRGAVAIAIVPARMPAASRALLRQRILATLPGGAAVPAAAAFSLLGAMTAVAAVGLVVAGAWALHEPSVPQVVGSPAAAAAGLLAKGDGAAAAVLVASGGEAQEGARVLAATAAQQGTIAVLVRHAETEAPLAGVEVHAVSKVPDGAPAEPAGLASVTTARESSPRSASAVTDAAGRASLRLLAGPAQLYSLGTKALPATLVVPAGGTVEHTLLAPTNFVTDVTVLDAAGRRLPGVRIAGWRNPDSSAQRAVAVELGQTDAEGRWQSARTEQQLVVFASMAGVVDSVTATVADGQPVSLQLGAAAVPFAGRLVTAAGAAVAGALLACIPVDAAPQTLPFRWRTGPQGEFAFHGCAAGSHHVLVERAEGGWLAIPVAIPAGGTVEARVALPVLASLRVVLRRADGGPMANSPVRLECDAGSAPAWLARRLVHRGSTDTMGEWQLPEVMPGKWWLHAYGAGQQELVREVDLLPGAQGLLEHAFAPNGDLLVEVVDERGAPRPGLRVQLGEDPARVTDARGCVQYAELGPGEHELVITGANHGLALLQTTVQAGAPARVVVAASTGTASVRGQLRRQAVGDFAGYTVSLLRDGAEHDAWSSNRQMARATVDGNSGVFVCNAVPAGNYRLWVQDERPRTVALQSLVVAVDAAVVELGEVLCGLGGLQVRSAAIQGSEKRLWLRRSGDEVWEPWPVQATAGQATGADLPCGRWQVLVWGADCLPAVGEAEVAGAAGAVVVVHAQPGLRTRLRIAEGGIGKVAWTMPDGQVLRFVRVGSGELVLGAPPGPQRVEYLSLGGKPAKRYAAEFVVQAAGGAVVELVELVR